MKSQDLVLILIIIILLAIAGFLYYEPAEPRLQEVTVMMPFIPQVQWAAYYTAIHNGYYEDEGLDVSIEYSTRGGAGPIEQLVGGNVEFVLTDADSIVMAKSRGVDLVAVYAIEPTNVFYILSEKDKNITTPADLAGKSVGVISSASGAYSNLLLILYLSNMGIDDVEVIHAGTAVVPSFLERKFDAVGAHLSQKLLIEDEGLDLNVINAYDYSDIATGHIAVTRDMIESNPELISRFLRATKRGIEYATNNPEEAVEIYIKLNPDAESKRNVSQKLWNAFIENYRYAEGISGTESHQFWEELQDLLYNVGMIAEKTELSEIYTNEFVPQ
jgi:NitT/TauT family transport system substrate-binding protein